MKKMIGAVVVVLALVAQVGATETAKVSDQRLNTLGVAGLKGMSDADAAQVRGSGMMKGHMGMMRGTMKTMGMKSGTMGNCRCK